jgi:hypothetical protein
MLGVLWQRVGAVLGLWAGKWLILWGNSGSRSLGMIHDLGRNRDENGDQGGNLMESQAEESGALLAGVPLQGVSILLGHTRIKVTEKH